LTVRCRRETRELAWTTARSNIATSAIDDPAPVRQVRAFTVWVGDGRALTQAGHITIANARELVALLDTGDVLDPAGGTFDCNSSAELPGLSLVVAWAKACRLVRVARGRLVAVKKHAALLERPSELWDRMLDVFPLLGPALCPGGWAQSFLREQFAETIGTVLVETHRGGGTITIADASARAWELATARYLLDGAPELHRTTWRMTNDRDLRHALATLEHFGAMRRDGDTMVQAERALAAMRRATAGVAPTGVILQIRVTLLGVVRPPVWRRLLVPADIRLDRLHDVIQVAMGWTNSHLHAFSADGAHYGPPNPELDHRDERKATLDQVVRKPGDRIRYTYDFGDDWEHEIVVEQVVDAEPGTHYPVCTGGKSRCPPEDCGGPWGYASLRETLENTHDDRHAEMLEWLAVRRASEFDPDAFDLDKVNAIL
jgi:hypothetical protein